MSIPLDVRALLRKLGPLYHLNEHQSATQINQIKSYTQFILDETINQSNKQPSISFEPADRRIVLSTKQVKDRSILQSINYSFASDPLAALCLLSFSAHAAVYSFPQLIKQSVSQPLLMDVNEFVSDARPWSFLIDDLTDSQLCVSPSEPYQSLINRSIDRMVAVTGRVRSLGPVMIVNQRRMRHFTLLLQVNNALSRQQTGDDKHLVNQAQTVDRKTENLVRRTHALHRYQLECQAEDETINSDLRAGALVRCVGLLVADQAVKPDEPKKRSLKSEFTDGGVKTELADDAVSALLQVHCLTLVQSLGGSELLRSPGLQPALALRETHELFGVISSHRLHAGFPSIVDEGVNAALLLALAGADHRSLPASIESPKLHTLIVCDRSEEERQVSRRLLSAMAMCVPKGMYLDCAPQEGKVDQVPYISHAPILKSMEHGTTKVDPTGDVSGVNDTGALAMCDDGHCFVDSIDCLPLDQLPALSHAMKTGKVGGSWSNQRSHASYVRCFVNHVYDARCCVVAACSTKEPEWNDMKTIIENVDLPEWFIQSFDLVIRIGESTRTLGIESASTVAARWEALGASMRQRMEDGNANPFNNPALSSHAFTHYMEAIYAVDRPHCTIAPGTEAWDLMSAYRSEHRLSRASHIVLIKLAMAHARCNWSSQVSVRDARVAIRVFEATASSAPLEKRRNQGSDSHTKLTVSSIKKIWKTLQRSISDLPDTEDGFISHEQFDNWVRSQNVNISMSDSDTFTQQLCDQSGGELLKAPGGFKWNGRAQ